MLQPSLAAVEFAVIVLAALALALALSVYLVMETYHRHQIARSARRLILSSKLFPPLGGEALQKFWSRSRKADRELVEDILVGMCRSTDGQVRALVERSIVESGLLDRWARELQRHRASRRLRAAVRLGCVNNSRAAEALARAADDPSSQVRLCVVLGLGRLKDWTGLPGLLKIASRPDLDIPDLTMAAALAACAETSPSSLVSLLTSPGARQRIISAWALSEVADLTVLRPLLVAAEDHEPEVRAKVARALARLNIRDSTQALYGLAHDPVWYVRVRALDALGKRRELSDEPAVLAGLDDEVREVRYRAAFVLRNIAGMRGELVAHVFRTMPRSSFESLISEWSQGGFIWHKAAGLSLRDAAGFHESLATLRILVAAGKVRSMQHLMLVFPNVKVRLRLLRLLLESPSKDARAGLLALAAEPRCDSRVAAAIRRAFPESKPPVAATAKPSMV